ncbi:cell division protein FtsH [Williamsoniiplasma somnilux]|uniref:ATP-dependent zinc metalloprotease FtsH n=1 Tax=Williamsoniiplasma somnilux TaxID=215578 RepID=A0A2K8NZ39_9MOLU|nr:ATP-dependent zinc metalloprotease FtsH [Williamsoniiplasma somnilux]ATZ19100.1 cell division protein FtsH [Williamsoniiplasma somnilux]
MKKKRKSSVWLWIILLLVLIIMGVVISVTLKGSTQTISWDRFIQLTSDPADLNNLVVHNGYNGTATISGIYFNGSHWVQFVVKTSQDVIYNHLGDVPLLENATVVADTGSQWGSIISSILPLLILIVIYGVMFYMMSKGGGAGVGGANIFGMGKNRAKQTKSDVRFANVAGIEEEKSELVELVDYLKNPQKYAAAGARAPKGVLMEGPPGTGKTLLAKAVAGEAAVSFFSISGSEFEEMFVGVGASRVREMFTDAKKNAPCIIFIDEIDAVGRKRSGNIGGSTNEQTLNQLLVEMDGFGTNSGVIVMAATNRADVLDPALLRPGRFDRVIQVSLPDIREREAILKLHAKNKNIDKSVDWHRVAERTPGFSGAQLENVLNEAAILMVRENKTSIGIVEIDEAIDRVVGGPAKKSRAMTLQDKKIVSYHESGHALVGLKLEAASKVQKVTIIPRGNAGGYTIMTPKDETVFSSKKDLYAMIAGYLGGRAAEEIIFGVENVTTGAHDDLDKATNIARRMVVQFGMSELGMTKYLTMAEESYGKIEGTYSEETAAKIDKAIQRILDEAYKEAVTIIKANREELDLLAESLKVLETITAEQIDYIDKEGKLPAQVLEEKAKYENEQRKKESGDIIDIDVDDLDIDTNKTIKITFEQAKTYLNTLLDKYSKELAIPNADSALLLTERSKVDGSLVISESKTELQKHLEIIVENKKTLEPNFKEQNSKNMTKKEIIQYMDSLIK